MTLSWQGRGTGACPPLYMQLQVFPSTAAARAQRGCNYEWSSSPVCGVVCYDIEKEIGRAGEKRRSLFRFFVVPFFSSSRDCVSLCVS